MKLAARRWGSDQAAPLALLLHGATGSAETWWRVAPALVDAGWQVIALDLRGHGSSPRAGGPFTISALADDVMDTIGDEPIDVAWGHSLGALTVMQLLAEDPSAARRAVLEDPPDQRPAGWSHLVPDLRSEADELRRDHTGFVRRLLRENPSWTDADALAAAAGIAACDTESLAASYERGLDYDTVALVGGLEVPTLLLIATRGVLAEPDRSALRRWLPPGSVVELEGGHSLHRDRFDDYLRITLDWIRRSAGAG